MTTDHRKHRRAPMSGVVKFYEWNRPFQAESAEISAEGMFLATAATLAEGAMVTVRLALPGLSRAFTVLAKVVRTVRGNRLRRSGLGLRFVDIAASDRRSILEYVDQRGVGAT